MPTVPTSPFASRKRLTSMPPWQAASVASESAAVKVPGHAPSLPDHVEPEPAIPPAKNGVKALTPRPPKVAPPPQQKLGRPAPLKVVRVDAFKLRNRSTDWQEFGNFGTHLQWSKIPKDEVWVADTVPDKELPFLLASAEAQLRAHGGGASQDDAYEYGLAVERAERERHPEVGGDRPYHDEVIPDVYAGLWKTVQGKAGPVQVWIVNGLMVRNTTKTDFVEGGHAYVYPFMPEDEIWIEDQVSEEERSFVLLHEFTERHLMRNRKVDYDKAHEYASKVEFAAREAYEKDGTLPTSYLAPGVDDAPAGVGEEIQSEGVKDLSEVNRPNGRGTKREDKPTQSIFAFKEEKGNLFGIDDDKHTYGPIDQTQTPAQEAYSHLTTDQTRLKALDKQGGELPAIPITLLKEADFVTLPRGVDGTRCTNCLFVKDKIPDSHYCAHRKLTGLPVTEQDTCAYWDRPGTLRAWDDESGSVADPENDTITATLPEALAAADFITFPTSVKGSNCSNCVFMKSEGEGHYCDHQRIRGQPVTPRNCCKYWDTKGAVRAWAPDGEQKTKSLGTHKFGCLMLDLPADLKKEVRDWAIEHVLDCHLGPDGRELSAHVTVAYGFDDSDVLPALSALLARHGPVSLRLADELSIFEGPNKDGTPLKVEIVSDDLRELHALVASEFPLPGNKHTDYKPHLTLAYLSGEDVAPVYLKEKPSFLGREVVATVAVFGAADKTRTEIPLSFLTAFGQKAFEEVAPEASAPAEAPEPEEPPSPPEAKKAPRRKAPERAKAPEPEVPTRKPVRKPKVKPSPAAPPPPEPEVVTPASEPETAEPPTPEPITATETSTEPPPASEGAKVRAGAPEAHAAENQLQPIEENPNEPTTAGPEPAGVPGPGGPAGPGGAGGGGAGRPDEKGRIITARADITRPADPGVVPEALRGKLREHQVQGVAKAIHALDTYGGFILADGTGAGKSHQLVATAKTYADQGYKVLVVAPSMVLKPDWATGAVSGSYADAARDLDTELSLSRDQLKEGGVTLTTYQNLAAFEGQVDEYTILITDECFPYDVPVLTNRGWMKIGEIVEKRIPVKVLSRNLSTDVLEYKEVVRWVKNPLVSGLVRVHHEQGHFDCTLQHKVWTHERGYVRAGELVAGLHLQVLREELLPEELRGGGVRDELLHAELCFQGASAEAGGCRGPSSENDEAEGSANVRLVREGENGVAWAGEEKPLLREVVLCQVANDAAGDLGEVRFGGESQEIEGRQSRLAGDRGGTTLQKGSFGPNESAKSDGDVRRRGENDGDEGAKRYALRLVGRAWRQWEVYAPANRCVGRTRWGGRRLGNGPAYQNRRGGWVSDKLQGGRREPSLQNRHRDRRTWSFVERVAAERPEEGGKTGRARVAYVEVLERGGGWFSGGGSRENSPSPSWVYNLEVVDNHNYFAAGALVSNSHNAKRLIGEPTLSEQAVQMYNLASKAGGVVYATATPIDKPYHLAYLFRAKVFGDRPYEEVFEELGLQRAGKQWKVNPDVGMAEMYRRLGGLFDRLTEDGLMVKREISMEGVGVNFDTVPMPPEVHDLMKRIAEAGEDEESPGMAAARVLLNQRLQQEPYKVPAAVDKVKKALADGRQVVVFAGRVNEATVKNSAGEVVAESEGTLKLLKEALAKEGITDVSELHGGVAEAQAERQKLMRRGMDDFQSGKNRVVIATIASGGTGINLDDTVGNAPRTVVMMTPPFSAMENVQAAGRVWRLNTKSNPRIEYLFGDTEIDQWNASLVASKMKTLRASVAGAVGALDVSQAPEDVRAEQAATEGAAGPRYPWAPRAPGVAEAPDFNAAPKPKPKKEPPRTAVAAGEPAVEHNPDFNTYYHREAADAPFMAEYRKWKKEGAVPRYLQVFPLKAGGQAVMVRGASEKEVRHNLEDLRGRLGNKGLVGRIKALDPAPTPQPPPQPETHKAPQPPKVRKSPAAPPAQKAPEPPKPPEPKIKHGPTTQAVMKLADQFGHPSGVVHHDENDHPLVHIHIPPHENPDPTEHYPRYNKPTEEGELPTHFEHYMGKYGIDPNKIEFEPPPKHSEADEDYSRFVRVKEPPERKPMNYDERKVEINDVLRSENWKLAVPGWLSDVQADKSGDWEDGKEVKLREDLEGGGHRYFFVTNYSGEDEPGNRIYGAILMRDDGKTVEVGQHDFHFARDDVHKKVPANHRDFANLVKEESPYEANQWVTEHGLIYEPGERVHSTRLLTDMGGNHTTGKEVGDLYFVGTLKGQNGQPGLWAVTDSSGNLYLTSSVTTDSLRDVDAEIAAERKADEVHFARQGQEGAKGLIQPTPEPYVGTDRDSRPDETWRHEDAGPPATNVGKAPVPPFTRAPKDPTPDYLADGDKAMSWLGSGSGGDLVPPPAYAGPRPKKRRLVKALTPPSVFRPRYNT